MESNVCTIGTLRSMLTVDSRQAASGHQVRNSRGTEDAAAANHRNASGNPLAGPPGERLCPSRRSESPVLNRPQASRMSASRTRSMVRNGSRPKKAGMGGPRRRDRGNDGPASPLTRARMIGRVSCLRPSRKITYLS
ncbi:hypothetical protein ACFQGX_48725 [Nonomuraea dietziae]|uniref:hypothetical protein n=1 Tax=Nonomuraea dietziae TaxID=65515 RepID=UPI003608AF68